MFSPNRQASRPPYFAALLFAVVMNAALGFGQDSSVRPVETPDTETPDLQSLPAGTQLIFKDPATGKVFAFPGFSTEMLNNLKARSESQIDTLFDLRQLTIEGLVEGNIARLTVQAWVEITTASEQVTVPLGFDDFQFLDPAPTCEFAEADHPSQTGGDEIGRRFHLVQEQAAAKSFRLFGKGTHKITFHLIGPVRTSNDRRRLKIDAPPANQSRLKLLVKEPIQDIRRSTDRPLEQRLNADTGHTEIETWGLAEQTELSWTRQINNTDRPTSIRQTAPTKMKLDLTSQPPTLTAIQPILVSGTPVKSFELNFPKGYADLSVTAASGSNPNLLVDVVERENQSTLLDFESAVSGAIELTYNLEYTAADDAVIVVRPPDLNNCDSENADFDLLVPAGLQVNPQRTGEGSVKKQRTDTTAATRTNQTSQVAYRMLSAESELTLMLQETVAFYSVSPTISFETDGPSLLMTASFSVNVLQGSLKEVTVNWPGYKDWQLLNDPFQLVAGATSEPVIPTESSDDKFQLEFPERQSRQFVVKIEAFTDLEEFQNRDLPLSLPDLPTADLHSAIVSLLDSDEHSMQLGAADGLTEFPALPASRWPDSFKGTEDSRTVQLLDNPTRPVKLLIEQQRSETKTRALVRLSIEEELIRVRQTLSYDVRYRDIDEIRLNAPPGINLTVRLKSTAETLLAQPTDQQTLSYVLPKRARGQFDLLIDYFVPVAVNSTSGDFAIELPLVIPATIEPTLESIQIVTDTRQLSIGSDQNWSRVYSDFAGSAWITNNPVASAPIVVKTGETADNDRAELLILKSAIINDKMMSSTTYVLPQAQTSVRFRIPAGVEIDSTSINRQAANVSEVANSDFRDIELRGDDNISVATVVIKQNLRNTTLFDRIKPQFARPVGVSETSLCLWLVRQPEGAVAVPFNTELTRINLQQDQAAAASGKLLESMPLVISDTQRVQLIKNIEEATADSNAVTAFAGMLLQEAQPVYVFSRQTILLAAAILGLVTYFLFASLRMLPSLTAAAVVTSVFVAIIAIIPPTAHEVLLRVIPGCVVAAIAALLQRLVGGGQKELRKESTAVGSSTIFAIDQAAEAISNQGDSIPPITAFPSRVS